MNRNPRCAPAAPPRAGDFPALREFFRGYLHEDFAAEHGSVEAALAAFLAAAPADARAAAAREARALLARELPPATLREFLIDGLGAAWHPRDPRKAIGLLSQLAQAGRE